MVARIIRAHGVNGGLLLRSETDHADEVLAPGRVLEVEDPRPGLPERLTVREAGPHRTGWLLRVEELTDRTLAEQYAGRNLRLGEDQLRALAEDEYFLHDLVGLEVVTEAGEALGEVGRVYETAAAPILGVGVSGRERLIPFRREMVREVDLAAGRLVVELPEGLLDI